MFRRLTLVLTVISIFVLNLTACGSQQQAQTAQYDPSKEYAAFLVVNSTLAENSLNSARERSTRDGYEIGPVVYYNPGTQDFEALFKKLTPSKQISLIWIVGSLLDTPNIQKAIAATEYKGQIRYMPVTSPAAQ